MAKNRLLCELKNSNFWDSNLGYCENLQEKSNEIWECLKSSCVFWPKFVFLLKNPSKIGRLSEKKLKLGSK